MINNGQADLAITGGNVITVNPAAPRAQAVAVKFGRILMVGNDSEIGPLIGAATKVIDGRGRTVIPGLNDAHCHALGLGGRGHFLVDCGPTLMKSLADIKRTIAGKGAVTPAGKWIVGYQYDDTKMVENRFLNRDDLDEVSPNHPVWIQHVGGHMSTTNSAALKMAGLTKDTPDPVGGKYGRDPITGDLNGIVYETAQYQVNHFIPQPTVEEDREAIKWVCQYAHSLGLTSFTEASTSAPLFRAYQAAYGNGELTARVYLLLSVDNLDHMIAIGLRTGLGDDMLRIGAIKIVGDGAIAGRTAYLSEPYSGSKDDFGILALTQEFLEERVMTAHKAGFQIGVHANGDKIINMTLDAYEKAMKAYPRPDPRHRLEHGTIVNPNIIARIKKLGVVVVPFGSYIYYHGEKMKFYGQRISMMFAHGSFLKNGIVVGGSSDYTCAPFPPLSGIQACVTRGSHAGEVLGAEQKISVEQALWVYTMGSAYASFEENKKGSIQSGKLADMTILGKDPMKVDPLSIKDIPITTTIVGGKIVYGE
jgi:predicted amidohydrolase YtcJ